MSECITVKAAYGKELLSEKEVLQHYLDGKDFMVLSLHHGAGSYLNCMDCERAKKPISLEVRYGKNSQKVTLLNTATPKALCAILAREQRKAQARSKGKEKKEEKGNA